MRSPYSFTNGLSPKSFQWFFKNSRLSTNFYITFTKLKIVAVNRSLSFVPAISAICNRVIIYEPEQKARVTYDNILRLSDDPDVNDVIKFLREREIVHFQRFGEAMQLLREKLNQKNVYYMNPAFDI